MSSRGPRAVDRGFDDRRRISVPKLAGKNKRALPDSSEQIGLRSAGVCRQRSPSPQVFSQKIILSPSPEFHVPSTQGRGKGRRPYPPYPRALGPAEARRPPCSWITAHGSRLMAGGGVPVRPHLPWPMGRPCPRLCDGHDGILAGSRNVTRLKDFGRCAAPVAPVATGEARPYEELLPQTGAGEYGA